MGQCRAVKSTRQVFQVAMRERFSDAVEEITGVGAFMSQVHFDRDPAVEIFVLESATTDTDAAPSGDGSVAQVV